MGSTLHLPLFVLSLLFSLTASAQFSEISQGPGYFDAIYYDLESNVSTAVDHSEWDIAFNVTGRSTAIYVNEGVSASFTAPPAPVNLFVSASTDFETADTSDIIEQVYNHESDWENGAFTAVSDSSDPFDLGWGTYSPATHIVEGERVFFIQLRDGEWRKLLIDSLVSSTYVFTHAALDGSDEQTVRVDKADFSGKTMAYYSFGESSVLDLEPHGWDLLFTRYTTPLFDGSDTIEYIVTGVLQAPSVEVAKVVGVDPATEPVPTTGFSTAVDAIGYDWKTYDFSSGAYLIPSDVVYFIETVDSVYRFNFIDFEGSSTGNVVFSVSGERAVSALSNIPTTPAELYPNPVSKGASLVVSVENQFALTDSELKIYDQTGRVIHSRGVSSGSNTIDVNLSEISLSSGLYFVTIVGQNVHVVEKVTVK